MKYSEKVELDRKNKLDELRVEALQLIDEGIEKVRSCDNLVKIRAMLSRVKKIGNPRSSWSSGNPEKDSEEKRKYYHDNKERIGKRLQLKRQSIRQMFGEISEKNIGKCEVYECKNGALYGTTDECMARCSKHKHKGDIYRHRKICEVELCNIYPVFGKYGETAKRCSSHKKNNDVNVSRKRCASEACKFYDDISMQGYATKMNPLTGKVELCVSCHRVLFPGLNKIKVRKEQFILAEIQRCIPELEKYFLVWDCPIPNQTCCRKMPDMAWKIGTTLLHIEIDEEGDEHEDNEERIVGIHAASGCQNHICIRFNPDKTSEGDPSCMKQTILSSGDKVFQKNEREWNRRIPLLVEEVRLSFQNCLDPTRDVICGKRMLCF